MRFSTVALMLSSLSLIACGGDDGDSVTPQIDAPAADIDAAPIACTISTSSFGDKGALTGTAIFAPDNGVDTTDMGAIDDVLTFVALRETGEPADAVQVDLYAGYGVFPGAITQGTYTLSGDELDFATCGACVRIFTNVTAAGADDGIYMPTGGTLTVTTAGTAVGGTLTGSISNLTFHHVELDQDGNTTPAADAATCTSTMSNATFTGTLEAAQ